LTRFSGEQADIGGGRLANRDLIPNPKQRLSKRWYTVPSPWMKILLVSKWHTAFQKTQGQVAIEWTSVCHLFAEMEGCRVV
jgi:hypothetical protein